MNDKTYLVWSADLEIFVHVTEQEAKRIQLLKPEFEFTNKIFGCEDHSIRFLQKKGAAA